MSITRPRGVMWWLVIGGCAVAVTIGGAAGSGRADPARQAGPTLRIVTPVDDSYVSGPTLIRVDVQPAGTRVVRVSFFADGVLVGAVERPPFECRWDAGPGVNEHLLRVVAQVEGGRLVATARTKGEAYAEAVDVDMVQVTVTVTDRSDRFVPGLRRDQFRVFEDDRPQAIRFFASENVPLELTAAVDVSGSMRGSMPTVKAAVKQFLGALRPEDRVSLLGFNDNVFTLARPTSDPAARVRAVDRLAPWGTTSLYDVMVRSLGSLGAERGRRAVVVFTDGEDTSSQVTLETLERRAQESDATLYLIAQGRATRQTALKQILEQLARLSGGRAFFPDKAERLDEVFAAILDELAHQYLLGYAPPGTVRDDRWHTIRVEVTGDNYRVRARQGYRSRAAEGRQP